MATVAAHRVQFPFSLDLSSRSSRGVDDRLRRKNNTGRNQWKKSGRRVSTRCRHASRAGQKGETSFSIGLSDMRPFDGAAPFPLPPRLPTFCNRCAIRTDDAAISAPLARSGDSNSRPKLRARLARPFPRLPDCLGGEKKSRPLPCLSLPCLSLPFLSLSALHLHQLLTGCRARRAGQCCYHGDEEEGSRHFWGECYQDSSMTGGSQRRR